MKPSAPPALDENKIPLAYPTLASNYSRLQEINDSEIAYRINEEQNNQNDANIVIIKDNSNNDNFALGCMAGLLSGLCCTIM